MTNQEVFDRVWNHFVNEGGKPSVRVVEDGTRECLYRGPDGAKCAMGLLIPDELYDPGMEGASAVTVARGFGLYELFLGVDMNLLNSVQSAHDWAADHMAWRDEAFRAEVKMRLLLVAQEFNLTIPTEVSQ